MFRDILIEDLQNDCDCLIEDYELIQNQLVILFDNEIKLHSAVNTRHGAKLSVTMTPVDEVHFDFYKILCLTRDFAGSISSLFGRDLFFNRIYFPRNTSKKKINEVIERFNIQTSLSINFYPKFVPDDFRSILLFPDPEYLGTCTTNVGKVGGFIIPENVAYLGECFEI